MDELTNGNMTIPKEEYNKLKSAFDELMYILGIYKNTLIGMKEQEERARKEDIPLAKNTDYMTNRALLKVAASSMMFESLSKFVKEQTNEQNEG